MKIRLIISMLLLTQLVAAQTAGSEASTICWDTSLSMLERNLEKEFEILGKVFERTPNQKVQLLFFNVNIEEQEFTIANGDWSELKNALIAEKLDGATIYRGLEAKIKNDKVYFFTDGNRLLSDESMPLKKGNIIVNSVPNRNEEFLKRAALIGRARLMDIAAMLPQNRVASTQSENTKSISGVIYIDNVPSADIEVRVKGSDQVYKTDQNGKFSLPAVAGDSILVSSKANKAFKMLPIGYFNQQNMNVFLDGNVTTLEEVVVTEQRVTNSSDVVVTTGFGKENKEKLGYATQSIGDDDISAIQTDVGQSIQGRFSNVTLGSNQDLTQFKARANNTLLGNQYGLVVVDGTPIQTSDSSTGFTASASFIDPANIADITVLKGFAATNRYGTLGNGGVLLITTKNGTYAEESTAQKDQALVQNNVYDPNAKLDSAESATIAALKATKSLGEAYEKYLTLRNFNEKSDAFYLDSFFYFKDKDADLAKRIISNLWEIHPESQSHLKIVELAHRFLEDHEKTVLLNQEANQKNPLALQPYYVEGVTSINAENYQDGLQQLSTLAKGGTYGSLNTNDISKTIGRDLKNLVFRKKGNLNTTGIDNSYFTNEQINTRLVVEWSNSASEFNIQFVNPQNRFFNWEHTNAADSQRIKDEIQLGYAMEEFEIYDDLKGQWKINAEFLNNLDTSSTEPLVMLCTLYKNFGFPSQSKEYIWLHFNKSNQKMPVLEVVVQ